MVAPPGTFPKSSGKNFWIAHSKRFAQRYFWVPRPDTARLSPRPSGSRSNSRSATNWLLYLASIGLYILVRGIFYPPKIKEAKLIAPLGLFGGFLDAAGGGGWGPVVTSNLLIQGADPRKVVGTVNTVEFFLTLTVSAAFIWHLGFADVAGATLGLLIGGIMAAPLGAWAAKHFNPKTMLILVGIVLSLTSGYGVWKAWA